MKSGRWGRIGVALLLLAEASAAFSQAMPSPAPADQPNPAQESPAEPSSDQTANPGATQNEDAGENAYTPETGASVPAPLNIDSSSLQFSQEGERRSYLRGGVGVNANYDDNLLSQPSPVIGGASLTVTPSIGVDIAGPRLTLKMEYDGGYTVNQRFSGYNNDTQGATVDLRYRLSPHVNLLLHDNFLLTTGFFDQLQAGTSGLGTGVIQQPNLGVITPFTRHTGDTGTAELTYQYSAGDMVGVSATGNVSNFAKPPSGVATLLNSQSEEGDAFYTHRFTPRNWSGITYSFRRITFDPVSQSEDTHGIFLFHSVYLNRQTVLSFYAGPQYTELNNEIVSTSITLPFVTVNSTATSQGRWSAGGGASFNWKGRHTSVRASGSRQVNDGGGLLAAVDLTSGIGAVRRQLTRTSSLDVGVIYAVSHALDGGSATAFGGVKTLSGSFLWEQTIGRNLSATLGYARDYQQETAVSLPTEDINHNRAWVSIEYHFTRPLGQ